MKELAALSLLTLVKEHKKNCPGSCNISLFSLKEYYKEMIDRELNVDELTSFM